MISLDTKVKFSQIFAVHILILSSHGLKTNSFEIRADESVCGFPGTPAYGYVKPDFDAYAKGDVVGYTCRVGYILLGSRISRCTENGSWTEDVPICDDSMTTLGMPSSTPTVPGYAAEMAIDRDKETCSYLKPRKPRWWRIDLGNVHKVLSVAVTMNSRNIDFTIFVIQIEGGIPSFKKCASFSRNSGSITVVLSCAEGKGIVGEKVHIEDHLHTGLFEICEVEVQVEKDTGYDCGRPSQNLYSITYERRGSNRVGYGCIQGYKMKGKDYRTCLSTGQWSDEPPVCELEDSKKRQKENSSSGSSEWPLEDMLTLNEVDHKRENISNVPHEETYTFEEDDETKTTEIFQTPSISETSSNVEDRPQRKRRREIMNLLESCQIERETLKTNKSKN